MPLSELPYLEQRQWLLDQCFGTADFWDVALRSLGHESETIIANCEPLQQAWFLTRSFLEQKVYKWQNALIQQLLDSECDVVCVQNVGAFPMRMLARHLRDNRKRKFVGFCSYATNIVDLQGWNVVFTSFPWAVDAWRDAGINASYLPLSFGGPVLYRVQQPVERDLPITFVGGLGHRHLWSKAQDDLEQLASAVPSFRWYGYRGPDIVAGSALDRAYGGEVWGHDYYRLLKRSQIVVNRHGEIARGSANNMRMFEATGCGAALITEDAQNLSEFFHAGVDCLTYGSGGLVYAARCALDNPDSVREVAVIGQQRTLGRHLYENRLEKFLDVIQSL